MKKLQKLALGVGSGVSAIALTATQAFAAISDTTVVAPHYSSDIGQLINGLLQIVMVIAAILVFIYLLWGAIEWITSGGDKGKTDSARNKITAAVIGLIVLAASYALLTLVLRFLGFEGGLNTVFQQNIQLVD